MAHRVPLLLDLLDLADNLAHLGLQHRHRLLDQLRTRERLRWFRAQYVPLGCPIDMLGASKTYMEVEGGRCTASSNSFNAAFSASDMSSSSISSIHGSFGMTSSKRSWFSLALSEPALFHSVRGYRFHLDAP